VAEPCLKRMRQVGATMPEADVFQAIAHPARRQLLDALREREQPVRELAARFDVSRPATSQHLRVLLDAKLVSERRVGRENLYRITAEPLAEVSGWLSFYEGFWRTRLKGLRGTLAELAVADSRASDASSASGASDPSNASTTSGASDASDQGDMK
jgi:DNA-binding transcriptional ArsR family regulator